MSLRGEARSLSLGPASVAICYLGVEEALVIPALRLPRLDPPKNGGSGLAMTTNVSLALVF